jgi:hypothetical protein
VESARRHQRLLSVLAFGLLALVAELVGRSLTHRLDVGRHVATPSYATAEYYPFLLAGVKVGVALLLARLAWRFAKARSAARAGRRLLSAVGAAPQRSVPRPRLTLSPRLWLTMFVVTSLFYLVQTDAEQVSTGEWPLFAPWLHGTALPVFAVLAVVAALIWGAVAPWLAEYEEYAEETILHARLLADSADPPVLPGSREDGLAPRRLFGLALDSRPPPAFA